MISNKQEELSVNIEEKSIKLLGIKIDNQLTFNEHISNICKKVSLKLHALARMADFVDHNKLRLLMKAFKESQFSYCPLIWMFHSRTLNNRINNLHERSVRLVYKDHDSSFEQLLEKDNSFPIHSRNLQKLATEMFKVNNNLFPSFMRSIFPATENIYNLRNNPEFRTENIRTTLYGSETLMHRGPKTWDLVRQEIKASRNLKEFIRKIKRWKPEGCTCRMCKIYIPNLGFI